MNLSFNDRSERRAIDIAEVINAKVNAFIEKNKSLVYSAKKKNDEWLFHSKGRGENYYKFMIYDEKICRFLDFCYINMFPALADYLWEKNAVCPSTVLPFFGYILKKGKFHAKEVKDIDYKDVFIEMFSVEAHKVGNRHCRDVGGYCVTQFGNHNKLIKKSQTLVTTIDDKIAEFYTLDI